MYPIAFTGFGKAIHFYGLCIALGFLCGTGLLLWKKDRAGLTTEQVFDLCMLALFGGLIGLHATIGVADVLPVLLGAALVGICFGVAPAIKAAFMQPVQALQRE